MTQSTLIALSLALTQPPAAADSKPNEAAAGLAAIKKDWEKAQAAYDRADEEAKTAEDRKLLPSKAPDTGAFAVRYLKLAKQCPGTKEELIALYWAALHDPKSATGKNAAALLIGGRIDRATPEHLVAAQQYCQRSNSIDRQQLVPAVLARAKKSLHDHQTAKLLSWVCAAYSGDGSDKAPDPFTEAADLIVARFAESPDISHFCESLFLNGVPPWAAAFEKHLRTIADKNRTSLIRLTSHYALASVVRSKGVDGQGKAEELFRQFIADFGGLTDVHTKSIRDYLLSEARRELKQIHLCGLGKAAQEIEGLDIDAKPLKLSDYKGKVVLLVFWVSWCRPCMQDVPHEKELVERFKDRPFVLIGVNGDSKIDEAKKAIARAGIPWRSVANGNRGDKSIASAWAVGGWPTVYLIDHTGIIRENRLRGMKLDRPLEILVAEAEKARKR